MARAMPAVSLVSEATPALHSQISSGNLIVDSDKMASYVCILCEPTFSTLKVKNAHTCMPSLVVQLELSEALWERVVVLKA